MNVKVEGNAKIILVVSKMLRSSLSRISPYMLDQANFSINYNGVFNDKTRPSKLASILGCN